MLNKRANFVLTGIIFLSLALLPASNLASGATLAAAATPMIAGCPVFPFSNVWNTPIDTLPVHPKSAQYVTAIGAGVNVHPDFGSGTWDGGPIGIPFNLANSSTPRYNVSFTWPDQSDAGPYPIPNNPLIEYGSDHHLLVVDQDSCLLYELYNVVFPTTGQAWSADAGAIYDLRSNALRPAGWTSADAAGLPMVPGLVRYDEVLAGHIDHALRFTVNNSIPSYLWPARHQAPYNTITNSPPMGLRFRLKSTFTISSFSAHNQVILAALKKYGMIVADNGSSWFINGVPDPRWDNDDLGVLKGIAGSNFEAVDESGLQVSPDSGVTPQITLTQRVWLPQIFR